MTNDLPLEENKLPRLTRNSVPPNCHFLVEDAEDEWSFNHQFDYIHGRALLTCFKDPPVVIQSAFKALTPGGWFELQDAYFPMEYVGDIPTDCALYKWNQICLAGAAKFGRPWTNAKHYRRWFEETGFADVVEQRFYWPMSPWAKGRYYKMVGSYFQADLTGHLDAISNKVLGAMGWAPDRIREFLDEVRRDMMDTSIRAYLNM
jgi:SAM-dependent methyltransferase